MAHLDDLVSEVPDPTLRVKLAAEIKKLKEQRSFGLVFEQHIPETVTLRGPAIRVGGSVRLRTRPADATNLIVESINSDTAVVINEETGESEHAQITDLLVVRRMGEPIFPTLTRVGGVERAPVGRPEHSVVNAENYHALQLFTYLYEGQVDCIYIDPPYNTGARDWKYNNRYVDDNDSWRHSKWLSMMQRRLVLSKRLLKPDGVLIVTIDEHEVHHLRTLLEQLFPDAFIQMVTIVVNPKGVAQGRFARVEEYAIYCFLGNAAVSATTDDFMSDSSTQRNTRFWKGLLRVGTNALPSDGLNMVYPIGVDVASARLAGTGRTLQQRIDAGEVQREACDTWTPPPDETVNGHLAIWPLRRDGTLGVWQAIPETLRKLDDQGFVRLVYKDAQWAVSYVATGIREKIDSGEVAIVGRTSSGSVVLERRADLTRAKTVWKRALHDSGWHGSVLLRELLGERSFDFPKSLYAVRDTLLPVVGQLRDSVIVDFFAGSGTTLHATALLNRLDQGARRVILVTNNEVAEAEARRLIALGHYPGSTEFEAAGVFASVDAPALRGGDHWPPPRWGTGRGRIRGRHGSCRGIQ